MTLRDQAIVLRAIAYERDTSRDRGEAEVGRRQTCLPGQKGGRLRRTPAPFYEAGLVKRVMASPFYSGFYTRPNAGAV